MKYVSCVLLLLLVGCTDYLQKIDDDYRAEHSGADIILDVSSSSAEVFLSSGTEFGTSSAVT